MNELDLYHWIKEHDPEYRWDINSQTKENDVIIWVSVYALESFLRILPATLFDEGGIDVRLQENGIAIWASDICDHCDIDMEKIFEKQPA